MAPAAAVAYSIYIAVPHAGPVLPLAVFLALVACLLAANSIGQLAKEMPAAGGLYIGVATGGEIYSSLLQRLVVAPNEQVVETPYIQHNIDATRRAFGLNAVEERQISGDARLTRDDIARNTATLDNVRLKARSCARTGRGSGR